MTMLSESDNARLELEEEEQKPKNIALAIFRFGARRGIGVYYSLLSTVPILVAVLEGYSASSYFTLISVGLLIFGILFLARLAGMKRFYQMRLVMGLFEQEQKKEKQGDRLNRLLEVAITPLAPLLPLTAAAIFEITGSAILGSSALIALVTYELVYYVFVFSKHSSDSVLPWHLEDWLVALSTPALLLLSFFQVINTTTYLVSLLLLLLLAGVKSLYEAPQALVQVLSDKDSFSRELLFPSKKQDAISLSELASGGALSSFTRVGIMLALLGVEQITFTDLMLVVKVSKSSLNHSVNALADAGYVTVRKGFKTAGGPRTFIEITNKGKEAIRTHLENMQTLASKFLS
ncbi:MAG TPA: transcriptional regulator [Nitrososphaerales archaeon]|nr:transcriptional regulator [Nitrososphaerales archaeon]